MPCCVQRLGVQHGVSDLAGQCAHALSRQRVRQAASSAATSPITSLSHGRAVSLSQAHGPVRQSKDGSTAAYFSRPRGLLQQSLAGLPYHSHMRPCLTSTGTP